MIIIVSTTPSEVLCALLYLGRHRFAYGSPYERDFWDILYTYINIKYSIYNRQYKLLTNNAVDNPWFQDQQPIHK